MILSKPQIVRALVFGAAAAIVMALANQARAQGAEPHFHANSPVGLVVPDGLTPSRLLTSYENREREIVVAIAEREPGSYESVLRTLEPEAMRKAGFSDIADEAIAVAGAERVRLVVANREVAGRRMRVWMLLGEGKGSVAMVVGSARQGDDAGATIVRAALRTVAFRPVPTGEEALAAFPFRVGETAGFRVHRMVGGTVVLLRDGDAPADRVTREPTLLVSLIPVPSPADERARAAAARQLLTGVPGVKNMRIERAETFRQNNADWHESVATAEGQSGDKLVLIQSVLFARDKSVRVVGVAQAQDREAAMPRFRKVIDSIAMK